MKKSLGFWIDCFFSKRSSIQKSISQSHFHQANQTWSVSHNPFPNYGDSSNNGNEPEPSAAPTYVSTRGRNLSTEEVVKETLLVELHRKEDDGDLGLVVTGGVDKDSPPRVAYLKPDGIAFRSDLLEVGDLLISVNGVDATLLKHFEIVNMLQSSTGSTVLKLQYSLPDPYQMSFSVMCKRIEVHLVRETGHGIFGMTLRGGASKDPRKCRPLTVTQIRFGGPAEREGTLKVGDRILAINGVNMTQRTLVEVLQILQELVDAAFLVEYDVSVLEVVQNATGPLLVEIDKLPGYSLGITLSRALYHGKPVLVIDNIATASIADRCGALHTGDHLLSIDGISLGDVSVTEANRMLNANSGSQLQLEVVPGALVKADTEIIGAESTSESESLMWSQGAAACAAGTASGGAAIFPSASLNSVSSLQSRGTFNSMTTQVGSALSSFGSTRERSCGWDSLTRQAAGAGNTLLSFGLTQVCHVDTTEVMLIYDQRSFGLTIDAPSGRSVGSTGMLMEPPIITSIQSRGPAERCGVLQEGDRVLAINGQYLEGRTMDEVREMIEESGVKMLLFVEFNVAESIIPSSGVFVVKLAKRNAGLGITISCPRNRRPGQHMVISDVKKGSVAHRTGSIQPGDKLLAIDNVRLDNCTLEDSARVLQDTQDIVKLTIKKDENFADEPDPTHLITYTVELPKFAGPLGITISGSEEPFDPIFISSLTEGGLAEKTGALHVGDRLLAINGVSLRGKTLSDAVQLLQNAGQTVTLKITRPANKGETQNEAAGKHGSMDSALESWDSSGLEACSKSFSHNHLQEPHTSKGSSSCNSQRKINESGDNQSEKGATLLISEDHKETEGVWDLVTVTSPSASVPPSCCSSGGDEWSRQVDELDQLRAPGLDSFSDLPDITEVIGDNLDSRSTAIDAGYVTVDEMEARSPSMKGDDFVVSSGGDAVSDITTADIHLKEVEEQLQNIFTPTPIELMKITLYKQNDSDDFGFSLSDGVFEKGVYVGAVRPKGPAAEVLRPYDRLLQVNSIRTKDLDCCQVVPLIARAGNQVDLVISRNPLVWGSSETPEYSQASQMQAKDHYHTTVPAQGTVPRNSKSRRVAFSMDPKSKT